MEPVRECLDGVGAFAGSRRVWAYRTSLIAFIGRGEGEALDLGCGEGRISCELKALGYRVTATDAVAELVEAALLMTTWSPMSRPSPSMTPGSAWSRPTTC